jgi:UDP-N-acetylmuramate--alanine ligase
VRVIDYTKEAGYPTRFPGEFNVMNARAASAVARYVMPNLSEEALRESLAEFKGTWRRFEYKGKTARGADVYDDYAHHPTAVEKTMAALRERVGSTKIFVAFHPHLFSRTRDLLPGFATAFKEADTLLIAPIYGAREVDDGSMSSEILTGSIQENGVNASAASFKEIQAFLETEPAAGDVVMIMGAGDIYTIADQLVESS